MSERPEGPKLEVSFHHLVRGVTGSRRSIVVELQEWTGLNPGGSRKHERPASIRYPRGRTEALSCRPFLRLKKIRPVLEWFPRRQPAVQRRECHRVLTPIWLMPESTTALSLRDPRTPEPNRASSSGLDSRQDLCPDVLPPTGMFVRRLQAWRCQHSPTNQQP